MCQQGNFSPPGRTHFKENNRYALDLSNTSMPFVPVVTAAPGRVAFVYSLSDLEDMGAGLGYGNQVKVEHGDGYFTMYAHLDQVSVKEGDVLDTAANVGTIGFSGAAGNRHLHFSLHQGNPAGLGVYESSAMDALVTTDVSVSTEFRFMSSTDLRDGRTVLWDGALYGSENAPGTRPLSGAASPELGAQLDAGRKALEQMLVDRRALDTLSNEWSQRDVEWARGVVAPILVRAPRHAVARYWHATAVDGAQRRWAEAEAAYHDLLASGAAEPTWETWLIAWCHNRLGVIVLQRGNVEEARSHFLEARLKAMAEPERSFAVKELRELVDKPGSR
jgi:murein DD-endopeptidase MepM/ murein hydrolase activator NlpD